MVGAGLGAVVVIAALFVLADWWGDRRATRAGLEGEPAEPSRAWLKGPLGPWL
jgi:hypothetical protein